MIPILWKNGWSFQRIWCCMGGVVASILILAIIKQSMISKSTNQLIIREFEEGRCDITGRDTGDYSEICDYVVNNCDLDKFYLAKLFFCSSKPYIRYLINGAVLILLVLIFMTFGIITSYFLYPNLDTLSTHLSISKRISGLTLLALGNATPDIFSTYNAMSSHSSSLAIGELVGSANFVICFIIGAMGVLKPFRVNTFEFLKDLIFFTAFMLVAFYFLIDEELHNFECCLMILLYCSYVGYSILYTNEGKDLEEQLQVEDNEDAASVLSAISKASQFLDRNKLQGLQKLSFDDAIHLWKTDQFKLADDNENLLRPNFIQRSLSSQNIVSSETPRPPLTQKSLSSDVLPTSTETPIGVNVPAITIEEETDENTQLVEDENQGPYQSISKFYLYEIYWSYLAHPYGTSDLNLYNILTLPLVILFNILIPVYRSSLLSPDGHKAELRFRTSLFHLQTTVSPFVIHSIIHGLSTKWTLLVIAALFSISYISSLHKYTIPALGFIISIFVILIASSEIIKILKNIGVIFHISESLLGMTVLALGNSIGDMISNLTFVKLDLTIIGINACFGSPLLYILFGIGLNGLIINMKEHTSSMIIKLDAHFKISGVALIMMLIFYAIAVPWNDWWIDRKIGATACVWWVLITCLNVYYEVSN